MAPPTKTLDEFTEGDLLPFISLEWEGVDLTGYTGVLRVQQPSGVCFERPAIFDDAPNGKLHFEWVAGNLVEGLSVAEIELTDPQSRNETVAHLLLPVKGQLG